VVLDNLNTHTPAPLDEASTPVEARRILRKLDVQYTPVHRRRRATKAAPPPARVLSMAEE
jgi:hypothetical protein